MASAHDVVPGAARLEDLESGPGSPPGWAAEVQADLERLRLLPSNWDGYGAPAIEPAIIEAVKAFMTTLPLGRVVRPQVVPMSNGTLQLEWHDGPKSLELEFESPDSIHYLQWHPQAEVETEDSYPLADNRRTVELIEWFMTGRGR